jgi:hypothetical protein
MAAPLFPAGAGRRILKQARPKKLSFYTLLYYFLLIPKIIGLLLKIKGIPRPCQERISNQRAVVGAKTARLLPETAAVNRLYPRGRIF